MNAFTIEVKLQNSRGEVCRLLDLPRFVAMPPAVVYGGGVYILLPSSAKFPVYRAVNCYNVDAERWEKHVDAERWEKHG